MAGNDFFEAFLRNSANYNGSLEFYEDTHDAQGNYTGGARQNTSGFSYTQPPTSDMSQAAQRTEMNLQNPTQLHSVPNAQGAQTQTNKSKPLPTTDQAIQRQLNQNFVIYHPRTTADVEQLIAYLRRGEPALVDLDPISESPDAQRLMDFTSGAAYALGDRVITVRRNLFLITPDTIDVLKPEHEDK